MYFRLVCVLLIVAICFTKPYFDEIENANAKKAYYASISDFSFDALNNLITKTHTKQLSYDQARKMYLYPIVDRHSDGKLRCIYTNKTFTSSLLRGYELEYNCEHTVPQSWFLEKLPMRGDLHHLFTAEPSCNSYRSNYAHGQYDNGENIISRLEGCGFLFSGSEVSFEPKNNKGAVSRAILYFLLRYPKVISAKLFTHENLDEVRLWAKENISIWEKHRNAEIFVVQGNRNPFIDYPELVDNIDITNALG
jgi:hypothetical protein